jgi:hypothetical protein
MHHDSVWRIVLVCSFVLVGCGTPAAPTVGQGAPTSVRPAPADPTTATVEPQGARATATLPASIAATYTAQVAQESTAEARLLATPTPEPVLTPVSQGVLLRDVWISSHTATEEKPVLLYSSRNSVTGQHAFWQVSMDDIRQHVRIFDIPESHPAAELYGRMSPDGQWIAYLIGSDNHHTLYVVQSDGTSVRKVAEGLGGGNGRGIYRFLWSPDSTKLVFQRAESAEQGFVQHLYVYYPDRGQAPTLVTEVLGAELTGWRSDTILVAVIFTGEQIQLEAISIIDGERQVLAPFPSDDHVVFRIISPDYQKVLLEWNQSTTSVLDLRTLQMTPVDLSANQVLWNPDSQTLLEIPLRGNRSASIVHIHQPEQAIPIALMPTHTPSSRFRAKSASPDGNYIAIDHMQHDTFTETRIYDVTNDQWISWHTEPTSIQVLGWRVQP